MKNFENYFKKEKWIKVLLLFGIVFLVPFSSGAGSIRDVSQAIEKVQSIKPPFQFAVIGDSRDGEKVYAYLIKRILKRKPDFIIHLGDMVPSPREREWQEFFEASKPITLPFFPVVGNHDVGTGKDKCRISKEQRSWLEGVLSSSKEKFKLVFIHRPLFLPLDSLKAGRALDKYPVERDELHRLFLRNKVKAVFEADDHRYDRREEDGILYLISGGGGAPLYTTEKRGGYFHYVWISDEKEKIEGEVAALESKVQDRFVME